MIVQELRVQESMKRLLAGSQGEKEENVGTGALGSGGVSSAGTSSQHARSGWGRMALMTLPLLSMGLMACQNKTEPAGTTGGGEQQATSSDAGSAGAEAPRRQMAPIPAKKYKQQVWILGFDGVDPTWLNKWVDAGKLPNVKKLIEQGSFSPLTSTNPPQSPVAWASFATGVNPGGHGIYDFIKRDPTTYLPSVGSGDIKQPTFGPDGSLTNPVMATSFRSGTSFWKIASDAGVRSTVLNVPFAFPPDEMRNGQMLSGLGTPDLRGTNSTFTYFAQGLTADDARKGVAGGKLIPLEGGGTAFSVRFDGPYGPDASRGMASVNFEVKPDGVSIKLGDKTETVAVGAWSDWFDYRFTVTAKYTVRALGRFYVESLNPLKVFMYPPNIHPDEPWLDFTSPSDFGGRLKAAIGPYKTVGWTHDTNALNSEKLDDKPWLDDTFGAMEQIAKMGLTELDQDPGNLFIWVETATDRVPHMFTRATDTRSPRYEKDMATRLGGDPVLQAYQRMDDILGRFMAKMTPDTTLLVVSDHGFHTYRRGLHTNAFLLEHGYLTLLPDKKPGDKSNLFTAVDWSKTKAYSLGTGQIYINLAGREGRGIVTPEEYPALVKDIASKLEALQDPKSKEKPVSHAYLRDDIYKGDRFNEAPDIQVAFKEGWRTSWETMLGGIPEGQFADNTKKWSGDHSASDIKDTAGILISNRKLAVTEPSIVDIAPTVLSIFGVSKPDGLEGKDLFGGSLTQAAIEEGPAGAAPAGAAPAAPAGETK